MTKRAAYIDVKLEEKAGKKEKKKKKGYLYSKGHLRAQGIHRKKKKKKIVSARHDPPPTPRGLKPT